MATFETSYRTFHHRADGEPLVETDGPADEGWKWIDIVAPDRETIEKMAGDHGWDRLSVEDVFDDSPLSKFVDFGDHVFVVLHALGPLEPRVTTIELDAFLADGLLVTIRHRPIQAIDDLIESALTRPGSADGGPDRMLARIAQATAYPYLPLVDFLDDHVEGLEDRAIVRDPSVVGEVQALRRDATRLRRFVAPQREVLLALAREGATPLIGRRARQRFADVYEQLYRTVESLDGARMLLGSVLETYRSSVAEDMNRVMKVLTVFSAIVLPLGLLAGIWGMNFANMPELAQPEGYFLALGLMAVVAIGLWVYFARKGFIGGPRLKEIPKSLGMGLFHVAALPVKGLGAVVRTLTSDEKRNG